MDVDVQQVEQPAGFVFIELAREQCIRRQQIIEIALVEGEIVALAQICPVDEVIAMVDVVGRGADGKIVGDRPGE